MYSLETIDLGEYRRETYFLTGFAEPEPGEDFDPEEDAERYGVSVARSGAHPHEDNVEIVRMDDTHGQAHLDKVYLPPEAEEAKKEWLDDGYTYERMKQYLLANWKRFVDLYIQYNE